MRVLMDNGVVRELTRGEVNDTLIKNPSNVVQILENEQGRPEAPIHVPKWQSLLDDQGNLKSQYQLQAGKDIAYESTLPELESRLSGIQLNKEALGALRKRGLTEGPSEWAKIQEEYQKLQELGAKEQAAQQQASATSSAYSDLARKGGLSSGARERLGAEGARGLAMSQQDLSRAGMEQRLGIRSQDEQQRLDLLKSLPGIEVQSLQPEMEKTRMYQDTAFGEARRKSELEALNRDYSTKTQERNLDRAAEENKLANIAKQYQYGAQLGNYQELMKNYAAEQQAKATAASGSGGKK